MESKHPHCIPVSRVPLQAETALQVKSEGALALLNSTLSLTEGLVGTLTGVLDNAVNNSSTLISSFISASTTMIDTLFTESDGAFGNVINVASNIGTAITALTDEALLASRRMPWKI